VKLGDWVVDDEYGVLFPAAVVKPYEMPLYAGMLSVQLTVIDVLVTVVTGCVIVSTGLTASVTVAYFVGSCVLAAFTVTVLPVTGAVRMPLEVMLPLLTDHVMAGEYPPVPLIVAWQVRLLPCAIVVAGQLAVTLVTVSGASVNVTLELFVVSPTAVAVITAVPLAGSVVGAVYTPALEIVPAVVDHETDELYAPWPDTTALQLVVCVGDSELFAHEDFTPSTITGTTGAATLTTVIEYAGNVITVFAASVCVVVAIAIFVWVSLLAVIAGPVSVLICAGPSGAFSPAKFTGSALVRLRFSRIRFSVVPSL
jgi:hypothetical protein